MKKPEYITENQLMSNIGKNLRKLREEAGKTQNEVIKEIGKEYLSIRSLKSYESGSTMPEIHKLYILSQYYDCSIESIILGVDYISTESTSLIDILKRMAALIAIGVLVPLTHNLMIESKYIFVSTDIEIQMLVDEINNQMTKSHYNKFINNETIHNLIKPNLKVVNNFKNYDKDMSLDEDRIRKIIDLIDEDYDRIVNKLDERYQWMQKHKK